MAQVLRVPFTPLAVGVHELDEAAARYVTRVHRLRAGDRVVLFDPEARLEAEAELVGTGRGLRAVVEAVRPARLVATRPLTLLQAIGKADKVAEVVRDATALGVTRLVVVATARAEVQLGDRAPARRERWRSVALQAARQCGRGDLPQLEGPVPLTAALEAVHGAPGLKICLDTRGETALHAALSAGQVPLEVALLIGPEGGFTAEEVAQARQAGWTIARLGSFVLRTETAATAVLGAVAAHLG